MNKIYFNSPIGILEVIYDNNVLISIKITDKAVKYSAKDDFSKIIACQLNEYFSGKRKSFDIKLSPTGTAFQKKVWNELTKIPFGKAVSYSDIAKNINCKNAQRAVGTACKNNPIIIIIPCHRVISKNGNIGGFAYGSEIKQKLLNLENKSCLT